MATHLIVPEEVAILNLLLASEKFTVKPVPFAEEIVVIEPDLYPIRNHPCAPPAVLYPLMKYKPATPTAAPMSTAVVDTSPSSRFAYLTSPSPFDKTMFPLAVAMFKPPWLPL